MRKFVKILIAAFAVGAIFVYDIGIPGASEQNKSTPAAILQADISVTPYEVHGGNPDRIQPGSNVKLAVTLKNVGNTQNVPGTLSVRFAFPNPLENEPSSQLFETEQVTLPPIAPGQEITIAFSKVHKWPLLFDFIREDWAMREYQAVANVEDLEQIIGTRAITFSAYYYEGPSREIPTVVPSKSPNN